MTGEADELEREQAHFDLAREQRELSREKLKSQPGAAAHAGAAQRIRKDAQARLAEMDSPDSAVAFGRFDTDDGEVFYLGRHSILDDKLDPLVTNWKLDIVAPYYKATHDDRLGVWRKRTFECERTQIVSFDDLVFAALAADVAALQRDRGVVEPVVEDALLADLSRTRTGEMQDIVRTIQAAQYDLIRANLDQLLVIQGSPGTGKTAVALHRVSWLLYQHREVLAPADILVVGPNRAFVRYIRGVLPQLGDVEVDQRDLRQLVPDVRHGLAEQDAIGHLKGELRMQKLLRVGLDNRIGVPDDELEVTVGVRRVRFDHAELVNEVDRLRGLELSYSEGRSRLRDFLRRDIPPASADPGVREAIDAVLDRIWPQLSAAAFVRDLLGSEARLIRAAGDEFSARDVQLLTRKSQERLSDEVWSDADLALLDFADSLIGTTELRTYAHIVADEAQDLSPMQLTMFVRRSRWGSMTILGDVAQSAGFWSRDSWDDVVDVLRTDLPVSIAELEYGYRVPRQVYEVAARLLPIVAPTLQPPIVIRDGPSEPTFVEVDIAEVADKVVVSAMEYSSRGNLTGIICPDNHWSGLTHALRDASVEWSDVSESGIGRSINLLRPEDAKGLEFDAVIVVEPESIIDSAARGERLLYVALTRTTRHLTMVYSRLPALLVRGSAPSAPTIGATTNDVPITPLDVVSTTSPADGTEPDPRAVAGLARAYGDELRRSVAPDLWDAVLAEIAKSLNREPTDSEPQGDVGFSDAGPPSDD